MNDTQLAEWLLENGRAIIRYRTATELLGQLAGRDVAALRRQLLADAQVRCGLGNLGPGTAPNQIHGAADRTFESAMGKLITFGCRARMAELDRRTLPFRRWLRGEVARPKTHPLGTFYPTIVAAFLSMAGYRAEPAVRAIIRRRVESVSRFARKKDYSIYVPWTGQHKMPEVAKGRPLIDPRLYEDGNLRLPWVHDVNALTGLAARQRNDPRVGAIINYILEPEYQRLSPGYGMLWVKGSQYWVMGWDARLPGYLEKDLSKLGRYEAAQLVQRTLAMSHFRAAWRHPWLARAVRHLESFRTRDGTYRFPARYLVETSSAYWVSGGRMGLGENRRSRLALELESTFWMLKIRRTLGGDL